jgi:PEGA domain-containing protein
MVSPQDRSFVSSVVFLEIVEFAKKPVAAQIALKERFNALLTAALSGIKPENRIVLDANEGAAVSFVGDPEDALQAAMYLRDAMAAAPEEPKLVARIGINIGAVKLVRDAHGVPNIVGDGIDVAHRVMSFAEPGQLLASRAFYELVSVLSQQYAQLFQFEGSRTDHNIREHQLYKVGIPGQDLRASVKRAPPADARRRQQVWLAAIVLAAAVLALAIGVRAYRSRTPPPPVPEAAPAVQAPASAVPAPAPAGAAPAPGEAPAKAVKKLVKPKPAANPAPAAAAPAAAPPPAPAAAAAPGSIGFAITPWGEIYVDGVKRGVSPPLAQVQIAPGKHTIEVRNTGFPSYNTSVEVTSGSQAKIRYKFQ